jgi:ATP-dependent DNA helicase RecQ
VLLISPERLNNPDFRDEVLPKLASAVGLLVVDEAHTVSDWSDEGPCHSSPDISSLRIMKPTAVPGALLAAPAEKRSNAAAP